MLKDHSNWKHRNFLIDTPHGKKKSMFDFASCLHLSLRKGKGACSSKNIWIAGFSFTLFARQMLNLLHILTPALQALQESVEYMTTVNKLFHRTSENRWALSYSPSPSPRPETSVGWKSCPCIHWACKTHWLQLNFWRTMSPLVLLEWLCEEDGKGRHVATRKLSQLICIFLYPEKESFYPFILSLYSCCSCRSWMRSAITTQYPITTALS